MNIRLPFQKKALPPPKAPEEKPAVARYGSVFQTCTFRNPAMPMLGNFFLKAQNLPDRQWAIIRVSEQTETYVHDPRGSKAVEYKAEKSGLSLTAALRYLANFENTAADVLHQAVNTNEKTELGFRHYEAFAHREGIIFDRDGVLHRTANGEIVTDGTFRKDDLALFAERTRPARESMSDTKLLMALTPNVPVEEDAIAAATRLIAFNHFFKSVKNVCDSWLKWGAICCWERESRKKNPERGETWDKKDSERAEAWDKIFKNFHEAEEMLQNLAFPHQDILCKGVLIMRLFHSIQGAQINFDSRAKPFEGFVNSVRKYLKDLNFPPDSADALLLQDPEIENKSLPQPVNDFLDYCRGIKNELERMVAVKRNAAPPEQPQNLLADSATKLLPPVMG